MSRTKRDEFALSGYTAFRKCRTINRKAEVMAISAVQEEGFLPSNRQKHRANRGRLIRGGYREIAALRELPKACWTR